jgi:hypothetical protein
MKNTKEPLNKRKGEHCEIEHEDKQWQTGKLGRVMEKMLTISDLLRKEEAMEEVIYEYDQWQLTEASEGLKKQR